PDCDLRRGISGPAVCAVADCGDAACDVIAGLAWHAKRNLRSYSPRFRRNLRTISWATIGSFERSRLVPWNQPSGSIKTTWYSTNMAPAGSARVVAFT